MSLPLLTGCVSQAAAGGGAAVTAAENLVHWWKMSEGSTTAETDYGLAATSETNMVLSGVTSSSGGPAENGTPSMVEFDGVADSGYVLAVNGSGANTAMGDLLDSSPNSWSFSLWLKDESTSNSTYKTWWKAGSTWSDGFGVYAVSPDRQFYWLSIYNGYKAVVNTAVPTSGWRNIIVTFPDTTSSAGYMKVYFDGTEVGSYGAFSGISTAIGTTANTRLSFGCAIAPNGTANYHQACAMSDIRMYNKVLSGAEITAIAAGDW